MGGVAPDIIPAARSCPSGRVWAGPFAVTEPRTLEKIFELRQLVWRNEPGLADADRLTSDAFWDTYDVVGRHWIITVDDAIVAAARMSVHEHARDLPYQHGFRHLMAGIAGPFASLNRMVVHPSMRRQGLSQPLTEVRIAAARARGARSIIVEAAPNRVPPLRDLGFADLGYTAGEPWDVVRFTLMYLDLSAEMAAGA